MRLYTIKSLISDKFFYYYVTTRKTHWERKLQMRCFFHVSKVKESSFFSNRTSLTPLYAMGVLGGKPIGRVRVKKIGKWTFRENGRRKKAQARTRLKSVEYIFGITREDALNLIKRLSIMLILSVMKYSVLLKSRLSPNRKKKNKYKGNANFKLQS